LIERAWTKRRFSKAALVFSKEAAAAQQPSPVLMKKRYGGVLVSPKSQAHRPVLLSPR
jgi:hypothetical protein